MALKLITPPEPLLTVVQAKRHLQYDYNDQDHLIESLIAVATSHIDGKDGWLQRSLKPQSYDLVYDWFPCGPILIPLPPLISIISIVYINEEGVETSVPPGHYEVDNYSEPGWVQIGTDYGWPTVMDTINAVRIRFRSGYPDEGPDSTVPKAIQHAVLMMVSDLFTHRGSVEEGSFSAIPIPTTVKALLAPYRVFT